MRLYAPAWTHIGELYHCSTPYAEIGLAGTIDVIRILAALAVLKTKNRNRLQSKDDLRVTLSTTEPRLEKLASHTQDQGSH